MSKVVVRSCKDKDLNIIVQEVLDALQWQDLVPAGGRVAIKLDLNTAEPERVESANTSPALVEALCRVLRTRAGEISLVDANGYRAPAEEAFKNTGMYTVAERVGAKTVNLSNVATRDVGHPGLGPLPSLLFDVDLFMTMPVLKTHALTYFTGALKNQWGCIPRNDRIALHHSLDQLIVELNGILRPRLCVMDGIIGVEGRGPTNGKPRRLDLVMGSRDPVALDATAMRLVGLDPRKCRHAILAFEAGQGMLWESDITLDSTVQRDWADFEPAHLDWAVYWMNRLTKYGWFREYILGVDAIFYPTKRLVGLLRDVGIVR